MAFSPEAKIQDISRITPAYKKRLLKLGINDLRGLFSHLPYRYEDFSAIKPIGNLRLNEIATIQGRIAEIKNIRTWKKRMFITEAFIEDDTGTIKAVWYNQPFIAETLKPEHFVSISGKVNFDKTLFFSNPAYEKIGEKNTPPKALKHTGKLVPVYPETAGITSRYLRYIISIFWPAIDQIKDWLPEDIQKTQNLLKLPEALKKIHSPLSAAEAAKARRRLAFDEIFLLQLFSLKQKVKWNNFRAVQITFDEELIKNFVSSLPFKLTDAQRRAAWDILNDLQKNRPMNRLLEGDVGSGKTIVAAIATLQAVKTGWQAAIMAPTEILAQQHYQSFSKLFKKENFSLALFTGSGCKLNEKEATKKEVLNKIKNGQVSLLIGTHALIQKDIEFKNLVLAVVDEQHRFGVQQRAELQKNLLRTEDGIADKIPHFLSMTATPIPRTLALTLFGDLDISILDEMPKGRQEILTKIIAPGQREAAYKFIEEEIGSGRQAFVVCPRIEINENSEKNELVAEIKAVKQEHETLSKKIFPGLKINMLHGKIKAKEKEKIMADFCAGKTDILVSTSVIEVGIDVPNATVMLIEGADRFGLAQLHQFRGRIGRGAHKSFCFLFSDSNSRYALSRLKAMTQTKNGFELAQKDLELRGPGVFFGTKQSGLPDLTMASLIDMPLIKSCRQEAAGLLKKDPRLENHPEIRKKLNQFKFELHLE